MRMSHSAQIFRAGFLIAALTLLSACSEIKYGLYDLAMDFERSQAGVTPKSLETQGRHFAYLENQAPPDAETILLLHGFGASKENWLRFIRHLPPRYHIVALDLLGHGDSSKDTSIPYDIDDQVGYVRAFTEAAGLSHFHLMGNSMGGAISSMYAAEYPDSVASLVLMDPAGVYDFSSELETRLQKGENPLIVRKPEDFDALMEFAMEDKPFIPWPITSVLTEKAIANTGIYDHIFAELVRERHRYDFKQVLLDIRSPTLVLWGKEDRVINYRNAEVFTRQIANSRKMIIDGVGHAPMIEAPEETAEITLVFMRLLEAEKG
ncbi:alpha/beta fold hydrolase [Hahella sp. HN01]|nr:alpha/beta fold hydrolase [Hahella sp. HN01]